MSGVLTSADLFRSAWPRHTAKQAARAADGPVATAKAWVTRRFTPSADTLLKMARENAELRAELVRVLGEWDVARSADAARPVVLPGGEGGDVAGRPDRPGALTRGRR